MPEAGKVAFRGRGKTVQADSLKSPNSKRFSEKTAKEAAKAPKKTPQKKTLYKRKTYAERVALFKNPTARALLELMESKRTNLSIAVDVRTAAELLKIADVCGPHICVLKTHIDILDDFKPSVVDKLRKLAEHHKFMIFEDRKFADIGNTSKQQYEGGVYRIVTWADVVNAHTVSGPGIIAGLSEAGLRQGRGLLLLAEMSSAGSLAVGEYTEKTIEMARANRDFVIGFVSARKLATGEGSDESFIYMTPGVNLDVAGDALGQQYNTPDIVIRERGSDVIIVGRGIYQAADPAAEAERYRIAGWNAYQAALLS
eukprot:Unigene4030_Nuclearia_a/m.12244 Unigene4030_Nuclearia_a/g.12244  ORF Unigene4030_Nuclearia_a/g.12244 Unigene4030_Nuclearia_a/m.12244 type:complete len:313 (-) Unigene4030_Nuclearia_a:46-984(-)